MSKRLSDYVALPKIKLEGISPEKTELIKEDILQIIVEESLHLPAMFTVVVRNDYFPGKQADDPNQAGADMPQEYPW